MKTIYKYQLGITSRQIVEIPEQSKILSVANQRGHLCLWVMVNSYKPLVKRTIEILGTGNPIPESISQPVGRHFIGTVIIEPFVWHVFEILYPYNSEGDES